MRLLFAHPALLTGGVHEGAIKAQRALVAALHGAGHECEIVAAPGEEPADVDAWARLSSLGGRADGTSNAVRVSLTAPLPLAEFRAGTGSALTRAARLVRIELAFGALVRRRVRAFDPDWVVCENGTVDLKVMLALSRGKLALSVATTASLPFGPRRATPWWRSGSRWHRLVPRVFCVSRYVRDYLREHGDVEACVQPQLAYGRGPFTRCGRFDGAITMLNPTPHKGGAVFAALATQMPARTFRAIRSYSTLVSGLREAPNVEIVDARADLDAVLAGTSVLVVPSVWGEGFGMVCVDAMLRGIPVLASDDGGLPEATLGVGSCVPTAAGRLRRRWNGDLDFVEPDVDVSRWHAALVELTSDEGAWRRRADASEKAARDYIASLSIQPLIDHLGG